MTKFDGKSSWADYLVQFNIAAKLMVRTIHKRSWNWQLSLRDQLVVFLLIWNHNIIWASNIWLISSLGDSSLNAKWVYINRSCWIERERGMKLSQSLCKISAVLHVKHILQLMNRDEVIWLCQALSMHWVVSHRSFLFTRKSLSFKLRPSRQPVVKKCLKNHHPMRCHNGHASGCLKWRVLRRG